jgi:dolichol-phosphate mannosyltransferase
VVAVLEPGPLLQSFLPAIAVHAGFRVCERPVRHHPRRAGVSKYGLRNLSWTPTVQMIRWWWRLRGPGRVAPKKP